MKRLGLIVRSDFGGGLANQSWECFRHLAPEKTLVILMGERGRGTPERFERYDPAYLVHYRRESAQDFATMREFLTDIDVVLSIETMYEPFILGTAKERGIETVLYSNPELLARDDPAEIADRYLWPAEWLAPFPVDGEVLPWPCSTDVTPRQEIGWPPRFVHVGAPAFHDRNGSEIVLAAGMLTTGDYSLNIPQSVEDHWDLYRDADCLVLPRRYGCLSLTMLEAAAMGVPTLTTDLAPQNGWFGKWAPWLLIPHGDPVYRSMKGSQHHKGEPGVGVFDPHPAHLALAMDRLAARADVLDALRVEVREWAEARSWDVLLPRWQEAIRG